MEMIGKMGGEEMAHTVADLEAMRDELVAKGVDAKVHKFTKLADGRVPSGLPPMPEAAVLVIKRHDALVTASDVTTIERELWKTPIDTVAMMGRGKRRAIMNKNARHNNCMTDNAVRPASVAAKEYYAECRGSVADLQTNPELARLRDRLATLVKRDLPVVENNFYYEIGPSAASVARRQGAPRHGADALWRGVQGDGPEVSVVLELQGDGPNLSVPLKSGDIVVMSRVANGKDWDDAPYKRWTMRHATGKSHSKPKDPVNAGVHMIVQ